MDLETLREVAESLSIEEFARKYRGFFLARTGEPIDIPSGVFTVIREFEHDSRPAAPTWQIIRVMKAAKR